MISLAFSGKGVRGWLCQRACAGLMTQRERRTYDHRIKVQIIATGNPSLFPELEIPRSTAVSWICHGVGEVVTFADDRPREKLLRDQVEKLERRISVLTAVLRLVLTLLHVSGFKLEHARVADGETKRQILSAVERERKGMPLAAALRVLGLSAARFHDWVGRQQGCSLDDESSCPLSKPQCLTFEGVETIGDLVQSKDYRHMSIRALALQAQRVGRVFAHPGTWAKLIRDRGWRRPRLRVHPPKPRVEFRATAPNEARHVDVTIIILLDGTKAYLHAVIDNYSRRILAWTVAEKLDRMNTCHVLQHDANCLGNSVTQVYTDSGVENLNKNVDRLLEVGTQERVIAQVDVSFSKSMIEAWWRVLKFGWLFINQLDNIATLRKLVESYVKEHNHQMPHSTFDGQTPDELYRGRGVVVPDELAKRRSEARTTRVEQNRNVACSGCPRRVAANQ